MPEAALLVGAVAAGVSVSVAAGALGTAGGNGARIALSGAAAWLDRRRAEPITAPSGSARARGAGRRLLGGLRRSPELAWAAAGLSIGAAAGTVLGGGPAAGLGCAGAVTGFALGRRLLDRARERRSARLRAELAPFLELAGLELGAGASPTAAVAAVAARSNSELGAEITRMVAAARLSGGRALDVALADLAEELRLAPLAALAAALATSRDYGTAASQPLRAIALDLRRTQRRELIAISRKALTRVLIPAAVAVLFPFMVILLYPAVVALAQGFS